jgi:hypothetical protein
MGEYSKTTDKSLTAPASEVQRVQLVSLISRLTAGREGACDTAIEGLHLCRLTQAHEPRHVLQQPAFGLIAQGVKHLMVGDECHAYDPLNYLVSSVHLPVLATITAADSARPYLGLRIDLDVNMIGALIREEKLLSASDGESCESARGIHVSRLDDDLRRRVRALSGRPDDFG